MRPWSILVALCLVAGAPAWAHPEHGCAFYSIDAHPERLSGLAPGEDVEVRVFSWVQDHGVFSYSAWWHFDGVNARAWEREFDLDCESHAFTERATVPFVDGYGQLCAYLRLNGTATPHAYDRASCDPVQAGPRLAVTPEAPPEALQGEPHAVTLHVVNEGARTEDASVTLAVPANVDVLDARGGTVDGGAVTWNLGALDPGEAVRVALDVRTVPEGTHAYVATAHAVGSTGSTLVTESAFGVDVRAPWLTARHEGPGGVGPGEVVTMRASVRNDDLTPLGDVVLRESFPSDFLLVPEAVEPATGAFRYGDPPAGESRDPLTVRAHAERTVLEWRLGVVPAGGEAVVEYRVVAPPWLDADARFVTEVDLAWPDGPVVPVHARSSTHRVGTTSPP